MKALSTVTLRVQAWPGTTIAIAVLRDLRPYLELIFVWIEAVSFVRVIFIYFLGLLMAFFTSEILSYPKTGAAGFTPSPSGTLGEVPTRETLSTVSFIISVHSWVLDKTYYKRFKNKLYYR